MPYHLPSALSAALLLSIALCTSIARSQTGDIRLSPDPLHVVIHNDAKIQSGGRIGDLVLVVWGTTRAEGDTVAVNSLVGQILRDTAQVGSQQVLTLDRARPFGFVQVLPIHNYFLVLWNDKRGGDSAAYLQRVDTSGYRIGSEEIFSSEPMDSLGVVLLPRPGGLRLVWSNLRRSDTNMFLRDFDSASGTLGAIQGPLVGSVHQVITPSRLPGITLLLRGNFSPLLYKPDGTFETLIGEAARHFRIPYYLDDDGGLLTLENGQVHYFATLLDTVAYQTKVVPQGIAAHPGTWVVTRDSVGAVRVLWASGAVGWHMGTRPPWTQVIMDIYGSTLTPADTFEKPKRVVAIEISFLQEEQFMRLDVPQAKVVRGCGNRYHMELYFTYEYHSNYQGANFDTTGLKLVEYSVNEVGQVFDFGAGGPYTKPHPEPLANSCLSVHQLPVLRVQSDTASQVSAILESDTVRLSAHGAFIPVKIFDYAPAIRRVGDKLVVTWLTRGLDSLAKLGILSGSTEKIDYRADLDIRSQRKSRPTGSYFWHASNNFILERRERWKDTISPSVVVDSQRVTLYVADTNGWRAASTRQESDATRTLMPVSVVYDPDQKQTLVSTARVTHNGWEVAISVHAIDSSGVERWRVDSLPIAPIPPRMITVPIRDDRFMGFYTSGIFWFKGKSIERSFNAGISETLNFVKLHGGTILRWEYYNNALDFYLVDTNGTFVGPGGAFPILQPRNGASVALNDQDSGIAFVYGSKSGIRMTLFDKDLHVRTSNLLISTTTDSVTNPAAVIRNDTLFVLWVDYRNGVPDIYSTTVALKGFPTFDIKDQSAESVQFSVVPNPASDIATVSTPGTDQADMMIVDSYGMVRMEWTTTSPHGKIDLTSLPVGYYRVVLRGKHGNQSVPLVVMR